MAYLSYLGSHWALLVIAVLLVVGFGFLAWFTKNLKYILGAVVIAIFGFAYQASNIDGYNRKVAEDAQAQVIILQKRLLAMAIVTQADTQRAKEDAENNSQLEQLSRETPPNASACLDVDAARRVRAIGSSQPRATPVPARRHSKLLPWRSGRP